MKKQKVTTKSKCLELETTNIGLIQEVEQARDLNETLKKSLQDVQVDLLSVGDEAFERAKAQALCIIHDLDVSKMDFFKTVVDGQLVDIEKASPEAEVLKEVATNNPIPRAQEDEYHNVGVCFMFVPYPSMMMCLL